MKIDRLIGILSILLQKEKITAPVLAETFEVSRRTINRDIEVLCRAGIPLVTSQGPKGGISIMEGYRVDRTILTSSEMQSVLAGLKGLDSVAGTSRYKQLMEKLSPGQTVLVPEDSHIFINLSSWYKQSLTPKIELIKEAIEKRRILRFSYCAPGGESKRKIEPCLLVFQWSSWYVWGYCLKRQECRLFKLNRMQKLEETGEEFLKRELPPFDPSPYRPFHGCIFAVILCQPELKWRLIEEYGADSFTIEADGRLLFRGGFHDKDSLYGWLLSMGDRAELLEPKEYRKELAGIGSNLYAIYSEKYL